MSEWDHGLGTSHWDVCEFRYSLPHQTRKVQAFLKKEGFLQRNSTSHHPIAIGGLPWECYSTPSAMGVP
eukprot:1137263-Pelagomonas_calceolata.AAC.1